jgi:hypothetical protein
MRPIAKTKAADERRKPRAPDKAVSKAGVEGCLGMVVLASFGGRVSGEGGIAHACENRRSSTSGGRSASGK